MTEYTPNDGDVRWQYVVKRMHDGATRTHAEQEYTRWLTAHDARVRRDAARGALDGLAANMAQIANGSPDPLTRMSATTTARLVGEYKLNVYPEESP